jgi:hypothetical protein
MHSEKILNTAYSIAAAIVVFGAWAKLEQKEFGSIALTIGLLTESGIFLVYGIMEWRYRPGTAKEQGPPETPGARMTDPACPPNTQELAHTMEQTNHMLKKIFRTE